MEKFPQETEVGTHMARYELAKRLGRCSPLVLVVLTAVGIVWSIQGPSLRVHGQPAAAPKAAPAAHPQDPYPMPPEMAGVDLLRQTDEEAARKSSGCVVCHQNSRDPHFKATVRLGCCDCHGGDPTAADKQHAHVQPHFPDVWTSSANPVRSYTVLNHEAPEFIRFVNPGDLRIAHISCGTANCHPAEVLQNKKSMMTHGCMLWGSAAYNNGAIPAKWPIFGESYSMNGVPQRLQTVPAPTDEDKKKGIVAALDPLPRWEITQPGNILRIFERGGRFQGQLGLPERDEDPGKPFLSRLSVRGLGTINRTDPVIIGAQKTRLFDPTLNFLGTNDQPGDYRSSGCTSCHMIYANDRNPYHSGPYAWAGNRGHSHSSDPTIPKDEPGHPIAHRLTTAIPTSQCIVCHIHPGTNVLNSYLGFMWWDEESDGELIWPKEPKHLTAQEFALAQMRNPNEIDAHSNLSDPEFLANLTDLNREAKHTQFADFHGHGWAFKAVFKKDRHGTFLDRKGNQLPEVSSEQLNAAMKKETKYQDNIPVHQMDVHLEKGMHCIDCHFVQDNHGNTKLIGEVRDAIEITCVDCHGTVNQFATLKTTGPAAPKGGRNLETMRTPFGKQRFERRGNTIIQNSMVEEGKSWDVKQVKDTIDPTSKNYNERARLAKTIRFDDKGNFVWGDVPNNDPSLCAHANSNMSCITCHSGWNPSCFGCHLPQKANKKMPTLHWEGDVTRNYTAYNWQTLRDDVYMLARDGDVTGNRINPARSSCAIHVSSFNALRESIYTQQQTHSAEGLSGIAFSVNVPHTVRPATARDDKGNPLPWAPGLSETKQCSDCHLSRNEDNNAIMAQLLMQGTNFTNFMGRYAYVACGEHGWNAVEVTEHEEPQVVIGSTFHKLAYPEEFEKFEKHDRMLKNGEEHPGKDISQQLLRPLKKIEVLQVQPRGEYMYAACGAYGLKVFDIAFVDHKGFSEKVNTAPVSPLGQQFYVKTKYATAVASPSTLAPDPTRKHYPENKEQKVAGIYGDIYVTDKYEGLICVGVATTIDGDPTNNFLHRDMSFNPDGLLNGAVNITIVGNYGYICCDAGLVVVDLTDPKHPAVKSVLGEEHHIHHPHAVQVQFRYGYVCDEEGIKVLDVTDLTAPHVVSQLELHDAHNIYLARTYAYVAAGPQGLVILNIEKPAEPVIDQVYNAGGCINDLHDVKLGITYMSEFAYLADGKNGMRIVQLTSTETPGYQGFSPRPTPELIATYKIPKGGEALFIGKALDRDRAVDESGQQIAVFGRVGARPLNLKEQMKMYLRNGCIWKVSDDPKDPLYGKPVEPAKQ